MAKITKRSRRTQGVELMECCGRVCDERCRADTRGRELDRRTASAGILRAS